MEHQRTPALLEALLKAQPESFIADEPVYLTHELRRWIFEKQIFSLNEYTNLPVRLRAALTEAYPEVLPLRIVKVIKSSKDRTKKFLLQTLDQHFIEAVLIDHALDQGEGRGYTLCVSSQIGCPLACDFCATGMMKFARNLSAGEILSQYLLIKNESQEQTNMINQMVFMGMGEPLLNLRHVKQAIQTFTHPRQQESRTREAKMISGLGLGASRISISTSGILNGIKEVQTWEENVHLSISLHSAIQATRDQIMPDFKHVPLASLKETLQHYQSTKSGYILIEYIMIQGINDSEEEQKALVNYLRNLRVKINLIAYNHIRGKDYAASTAKRIQSFSEGLRRAGFYVVQRYKKGDDIAAACGQLACHGSLE